MSATKLFEGNLASSSLGKKRTELSKPELARFLEAATALHHACCEPLISGAGTHFQPLSHLNEAIRERICASRSGCGGRVRTGSIKGSAREAKSGLSYRDGRAVFYR
jgi:hypothetical protein